MWRLLIIAACYAFVALPGRAFAESPKQIIQMIEEAQKANKPIIVPENPYYLTPLDEIRNLETRSRMQSLQASLEALQAKSANLEMAIGLGPGEDVRRAEFEAHMARYNELQLEFDDIKYFALESNQSTGNPNVLARIDALKAQIARANDLASAPSNPLEDLKAAQEEAERKTFNETPQAAQTAGTSVSDFGVNAESLANGKGFKTRPARKYPEVHRIPSGGNQPGLFGLRRGSRN